MMVSDALRNLHSLYTPTQMKLVLRRERLRIDRSDRQMAVVVFNLAGPTWWRLRRLARILLKRCRSTDEVGWMSARQIGVVLTDTGTFGAFCFADAAKSL